MAETITQAARRIRVENPATGRLTAIVDVVAPEHIPELLARARAAQPGWDALGFEGRNELFRRAQKGMVLIAGLAMRGRVPRAGRIGGGIALATAVGFFLARRRWGFLRGLHERRTRVVHSRDAPRRQ